MKTEEKKIPLEKAFENVLMVVRAYKGTADEHHVLHQSLDVIAETLRAAQKPVLESVDG